MSNPPVDTHLKRLSCALTRFAIAITILNIAGHLFLGFEGSFATPFLALAAAYVVELALETIDAKATGRKLRYSGGPKNAIMFLRSAHITGLACSMLLFVNQQLWAIVFAVVVSIGSKFVFRAKAESGRYRHFFNPSNFGITVTLLLFPWVGIAPPYQFTEQLPGWTAWLLPAVIFTTGSLINIKLTGRFVLICSWVGGFALQALLRNSIHGTSISSALEVMTGPAFILFTFYMITDPMTTPESLGGQVLFGVSVAATYGFLMENHIVFGIFFGLTLVCLLRGCALYLSERIRKSWTGALPNQLHREFGSKRSLPQPKHAVVMDTLSVADRRVETAKETSVAP